jgi:hypothetical protein
MEDLLFTLRRPIRPGFEHLREEKHVLSFDVGLENPLSKGYILLVR